MLNKGLSYLKTTCLFVSFSAVSAFAQIPALNYNTAFTETTMNSLTIDVNKEVGRTAGVASVGDAGSASYAIPIAVPMGTAGMQPNLSVSYNSFGGDGAMGLGWGLTGLSFITRGNKSFNFDGELDPVKLQQQDAYYLDGARLHSSALEGGTYSNYTTMQVSGSNHTMVEALGNDAINGTVYGPQTFQVTQPGGLKFYYGSSSRGARQYHANGINMIWALDMVLDCHGNYMTFHYKEENHQLMIDYIEYTGNTAAGLVPYNKIQFYYAEREDQNMYFLLNEVSAESRYVITRIEVLAENNNTFRNYNFYYTGGATEPTKLHSVREDGSYGGQLNSTNFRYGDAPASYSATESSFTSTLGYSRFLAADCNSDGFTDLISIFDWPVIINGQSAYEILLNDPNAPGTFEPLFAEVVSNSAMAQLNKETRYSVGDFTGDQLSDLFLMNVYEIGGNMFAQKIETKQSPVTSAGWTFEDDYFLSGYSNLPPVTSNGDQNFLFQGDFDGNGLNDFITITGQPAGNFFIDNIRIHLAGGVEIANRNIPVSQGWSGSLLQFSAGTNMRVIDYDGDGDSEIMRTDPTNNLTMVYEFYEISAGQWAYEPILATANLFPIAGQFFWEGDFNGDAITDLLTYGNAGYAVHYGKGLTYISEINLFSGMPGPEPIIAFNLFPILEVGDFNGDGKDDIVYRYDDLNGLGYGQGIYYIESTGYGFNDLGWISPMQGGEPFASRIRSLGDFNGDGRADIVHQVQGNALGEVCLLAIKPEGRDRHLLEVVDGFLNKAIFHYQPLSYGSTNAGNGFYTLGAAMDFPINKINGGIHTVYSMQVSDGIGGLHTVSYTYEGLKIHRQGQGILGFDMVSNTGLHPDLLERKKFGLHAFYNTPLLIEYELEDVGLGGSTYGMIKETQYRYSFSPENNADHVYFSWAHRIIENDYQNGSTSSHRYAAHQDHLYLITDSIGMPIGGGAPLTTFQATPESFDVDCFSKSSLPTYVASTITRAGQIPWSKLSSFVLHTDHRVTKSTNNFGTGSDLSREVTQFDNFGNPLTVITSSPGLPNVTTTYTYDNKGRYVVSASNNLNQTEQYSYHPVWGKPVSAVAINGNSSTFSYDEFGRTDEETNSLGNTTVYNYAWEVSAGAGNSSTGSDFSVYKVQQFTPGAPILESVFDALNRHRFSRKEGFGGALIMKCTSYNDQFQVKTTTTPFYSAGDAIVTTANYDELGRTIESSNSAGTNSISYTPGNQFITIETTSAAQQVHQKRVDATGVVTQCIDDGGVLLFQYNSQGNLTETQLNGNVVSAMQYDAVTASQTALNDVSSGNSTYDYDTYGRLSEQNEPSGSGTYDRFFDYDGLSRITQQTGSEGSTQYEYYTNGGGINKLKEVTGPSGMGKYYEYDNFGRLSKLTYTNGYSPSADYSYDNYGRLFKISYSSGLEKQYYYNSNGYLHRIVAIEGNTVTVIFQAVEQNAFGRLTEYSLGNGITSLHDYSNFGRPLSYFASGIQHLEMTWDNQNGNLSERSDLYTSLTETFAYDDLDRLTQSTVSGLGAQNVSYYANGNIYSKTGIGDYTYNSAYRLSNVENTAGVVSLNTQQVQYNAFNEPSQVKDLVYQQGTEGWRMDFTFGADFQRILGALHYQGQPTEIREYYPELGYECVTDVVANIRYHLYYESVQGRLISLIVKEEDLLTTGGSGAFTSVAGDGYYYVYTDHLGSLVTVTDDQGVAVATQNFDAWGRRRNPATWDYTSVPSVPIWLLRGYTGHEQLDELGLIHMNGRLYDPLLGRMLSPDNYVQSPHSTQGYNRYAYVYNNPLKYTDPSGDYALADDLIAAAIGGVVNLTINAVQGNLSGYGVWGGIGRGFAAFGAGAAAGTLALYGPAGWAAGGAIVGGTNAWLGGGNTAKEIAVGMGVGAVSGIAGGAVGSFAAAGMSTLTSTIASPVLRGAIGGAVGGAAGGYAGGFTASLITTGDIKSANRAGLQGLYTGAAIGATVGGLAGYRFAKQNDLNPWTGESRLLPTEPESGQPTTLAEAKFEKGQIRSNVDGNYELAQQEWNNMQRQYGIELSQKIPDGFKTILPDGSLIEGQFYYGGKTNPTGYNIKIQITPPSAPAAINRIPPVHIRYID